MESGAGGKSWFAVLSSFWNNTLNLEQQQAALRIIIGTIALGYLLYIIGKDGVLTGNDNYTIAVGGLFFLFALIIIVWMILVPRVSIPRRVLGIMVDNGATTAALYLNGIYGAPLFVVYLWVTFGNGFRFGRKYLAFSALCSVSGYSWVTLVVRKSMFDPYVTFGLLIGLIILPLYVSSLLRQLTRSLELAESANQAKSNFLATMSHEIRTPLNGMVGITEMLGKTRLDDRQRHYVDLISKSSEWLMRVITDGLDFSKIEADEFLLMEDCFELRVTIEELCSFYRGVQETTEVDFVCSLSPDLPRLVKGDQLRLVQVLNNLLNNACKYTEKGQISLKVFPVSCTSSVASVRFEVADTGIGVAKAKQKDIFTPFCQAESGSVKKYGGTGLGLAIAERIVRLMGGRIEIESVVGEGSRFSFSIDFELPAEDVSEQECGKNIPATRQWQRKPLVLLAEDHEINREVVGSQLLDLGCEVTLAVNGREAIEQVKEKEFDLIFMDCQMPEVDGYEATREIRFAEVQQGLKKRMPVVALTAHVTIEDKRKCLASGMDDYLGKPFRTSDLRAKLNHWLASMLAEVEMAAGTETEPEQKPAVDDQHAALDIRKVCHDLRNYLFAIQGTVELSQLQASQQEHQQRHSERILAAVEDAVKLVDTLSGKEQAGG